MGYSRKRNRGVEDESSGVSKKQHVQFSGVNEKQSGISKSDQEKKMWNFQGFWIFPLEFPRDLAQFCGISRSGALFCLEFLGVT